MGACVGRGIDDSAVLDSLYACQTDFHGGVNVGMNRSGGRTRLITGAGPGAARTCGRSTRRGAELDSFFAADEAFHGGVFVA